jgi:GTP-binding protein HflX
VKELLASAGTDAVAVSARTGEGIEELVTAIADRLRELATVVELLVPYDRGDVLAALHREGNVLVEVHGDDGMRIRARLGAAEASRFGEFAAAAG